MPFFNEKGIKTYKCNRLLVFGKPGYDLIRLAGHNTRRRLLYLSRTVPNPALRGYRGAGHLIL
jgi:hypothetical protein